MEYEDVLLNQPVVFDNVGIFQPFYLVDYSVNKGSGTIKAGIAGEDQPKSFFPSLYVVC
jgi:centractin